MTLPAYLHAVFVEAPETLARVLRHASNMVVSRLDLNLNSCIKRTFVFMICLVLS